MPEMPMPMKNKSFVYYSLLGVLALAGVVRAQVGVGVGTDFTGLDTGLEKKDKIPRMPDPCVEALAQRYCIDRIELNKLWFRGYGRNELIKLVLIGKKSGKPLKDLVRLRDKNTRFSDIARKFDIDYPALVVETAAVRKELDYEVAASTPMEALNGRIHYSSATTVSPSASTSTPVETAPAPEQ
jgi:hypothetical protein